MSSRLWVLTFDDGRLDCIEAASAVVARSYVPAEKGEIVDVIPYRDENRDETGALEWWSYVLGRLGNVSAEVLNHMINEMLAKQRQELHELVYEQPLPPGAPEASVIEAYLERDCLRS